MVLGRAVDEIEEHMLPGLALQYEWITDEIEVVVTVIKVLQLQPRRFGKPLSAELEVP